MLKKNWCWYKKLVGLLLLAVMLLAVPSTSLADGGDGSGNTQGVFKPLGLTSATLEDGSSIIDSVKVPLKPKITMHFDKNVVYLIYWERNRHCFHLYGENGQELNLNLTKIDDTVDTSKRQYIWVEPVAELSPGSSYKLYVAPELLAKNGGSTLAMTTNNQGVTINFKTAGENVAAAAAAEKPEGEVQPAPVNSVKNGVDTAQPQPVTGTSDGVTVSQPIQSSISQNPEAASTTQLTAPNKMNDHDFAAQQKGRQVQDIVAVIAVILLIIWVAVEIMKRKKL